jgi:hypothetical protein
MKRVPIPPQVKSFLVRKEGNGFAISTEEADLIMKTSCCWEREGDSQNEVSEAQALLEQEGVALESTLSELAAVFGNSLRAMARFERMEALCREVENRRGELEDLGQYTMFVRSPVMDQVMVLNKKS